MVRPYGELSLETYRQLSNDLVKYAVDEPRAVIVVVDDLLIDEQPLLTAFTRAWNRISEWPAIPLLLVAATPAAYTRFTASALRSFVPLHQSVAEAADAATGASARRRVRTRVGVTGGARVARRFVEGICGRWAVSQVCGDASLIVTELVENAFLHTDVDCVGLRLELWSDVLTVAVSDTDPREAVLRETAGDTKRFGLHIVSRLSMAWGCSPQWPTGKVVWATLPTRQRRR
ncbi:ATP-binding protein [Nocardia sp. NPDC127526]|uniref:ATP-binding protein n=1 Tax=Nocardia sp. NPDC127526 TaxID=3345393 RepID=UPI0036273B27